MMVMSRDDVARIEQTLFFEPPEMGARLSRFFMLILFASVIASGGLLSDSVASVIGAMIVAPLMTPIMGSVVALVIGSHSRLARSLLLVATGIALAVAVGWIMAKVMPFGWNPLQSEQILSRTSPRLLDLVVALASGGAGAYALSRSDVADALPGVAISISLVPPLNTAGILLAADEGHLARGAFLLFLTNFAAILLAGTLTFMAMGLATGVGRSGRDLRNGIIAVIVVVVVVAIPLRVNSQDLWDDTNHEDAAYDVVADWLQPTDFSIISVDVDDEKITVNLAGDGELPPHDAAVAELRDILGADMVLTAHIVDMHTEVIGS
jgi:uncharacterized hydrophobic protein (TIGR00271 family)